MQFGMQLVGVLLNRFEQKQHVQLHPVPYGGHGLVALIVAIGGVFDAAPHAHVVDLDEVDNTNTFVKIRPSTRSLLIH